MDKGFHTKFIAMDKALSISTDKCVGFILMKGVRENGPIIALLDANTDIITTAPIPDYDNYTVDLTTKYDPLDNTVTITRNGVDYLVSARAGPHTTSRIIFDCTYALNDTKQRGLIIGPTNLKDAYYYQNRDMPESNFHLHWNTCYCVLTRINDEFTQDLWHRYRYEWLYSQGVVRTYVYDDIFKWMKRIYLDLWDNMLINFHRK